MEDLRTILKKYSRSELNDALADAENNFSFFAVSDSRLKPVLKFDLENSFNEYPVIYGFFNIKSPFAVTSYYEHPDCPGLLKFDYIFNAVIDFDPLLAEFVAVYQKEQWTNEDFNEYFSEKLKNKFSFFMIESIDGIPYENIKNYKENAFIDDDAKKRLENFFPAWFKTEYSDLNITNVDGIVKAADKGDKEYFNQMKSLADWAKKEGIDPVVIRKVINETITLKEAELRLKEHLANVTFIDSKIGYKERVAELAAEIVDKCGIPLNEAVDMIEKEARGNINIAEEFVKDYIRKFEDIKEFRTRFDIDIITARNEIDYWKSTSKAIKVWMLAGEMQSCDEYKNKEVSENVDIIKQKGYENIIRKIDENKNKSKNVFKKLLGKIIIRAVIAAAGYFVYNYFNGLLEEFSIKIVSGNPANFEKIIFNKFGNKFEYDSNTRVYRIKSLKNKKIEFIEELKKNNCKVELSSSDLNSYLVVDNSSASNAENIYNNYYIRIANVKNSADYDKIVKLLSEDSEFEVKSHNFRQNKVGISFVVVQVNSLLESSAAKNKAVSILQKNISGLKLRDIKVTLK